jgi:multisubunit Na+/H+ antiporter MnhB subunit
VKSEPRGYPDGYFGELPLSLFDIIGLVVVAIGLVFIWIRRNKEAPAVRSRRRLGLIVAGLGGVLLVGSFAFSRIYALWPAAVLILLFGVLYWLLNRIDPA